jgi:hypothetical protein
LIFFEEICNRLQMPTNKEIAMNLNPLLINIVVLERELEIQRQGRAMRKDGCGPAESELQPSRKKLKWSFFRIRRRQACESS